MKLINEEDWEKIVYEFNNWNKIFIVKGYIRK